LPIITVVTPCSMHGVDLARAARQLGGRDIAPQRGDPAVAHRHIAVQRWTAGAVDNAGIADDERVRSVGHDLLLGG
jgi:hypothetical protein